MRTYLVVVVALLAACGEDVNPRRVGPFRGVPSPPPLASSEPVGLNFPPDELEVGSGQWGYDINESRDIRLTANRSIWFKATSTALAFMRQDAAHLKVVQAGRSYKASCVFQADATSASSHDVSARIEWLAADGTTMITATFIHFGEVAAINTWERAEVIAEAPEGAFFARVSFGRADPSFNVYFDFVNMVDAVPLWHVRIDGAQSVNTATDTTVLWDAGDLIDVTLNTSGVLAGNITIEVPGFYLMTAGVAFGIFVPGFNDGTDVEISLYLNGGSAVKFGDVREIYAPGGAGTGKWIGTVTHLMELDAGDEVSIVVRHNHGSARSIDTGFAQLTSFCGHRVM